MDERHQDADFERWRKELFSAIIDSSQAENPPIVAQDDRTLISVDNSAFVNDVSSLLGLDQYDVPIVEEFAAPDGWREANLGDVLVPPPVRGLLALADTGYEPGDRSISVGFWSDFVAGGRDIWDTPCHWFDEGGDAWNSMVHLYGPRVIGCWVLLGGADNELDVRGLYYAASAAMEWGIDNGYVIDAQALTSMRMPL